MDLTGLPATLIAELTGVSLKTATRWKRQKNAPAMARTLIKLRHSADLGQLASPWAGFGLTGKVLWTPENDKVSPGDIRAIQYRVQQLGEYEREMKRPRQYTLL